MPEELKDIQTDNPIEPEPKVEPVVEPKVDDERSFKDKVVGVIKNIFTTDSKDSKDGEGSKVSEDIPDDFSKAANAAGWTDEQVIEYAKNKTDAELLELVPHLVPIEDKTVEPEVKPEAKVEPPKEDKEVDSLIEKLLPKLQEKLGIDKTEATKLITELKTERENSDFIRTMKITDEMMDTFSKEFSELGLKKDMPVFPAGSSKGQLIPTSPQFKARSELYGFAVPFLKEGQSIDEAMTNALYTYKGKHGMVKIERDIIKDLKNHEKRLSGSRTAKEVKKTYSNDREEGIATIRDILSQQGQES